MLVGMIVSFILGMVGLAGHLGFKAGDSIKNKFSKNPKEYIIKNKDRLLTSFGSFMLIYISWIVMLIKPELLPEEAKKILTELNLKQAGLVWITIGYTADSIIRNVWNMIKAKFTEK